MNFTSQNKFLSKISGKRIMNFQLTTVTFYKYSSGLLFLAKQPSINFRALLRLLKKYPATESYKLICDQTAVWKLLKVWENMRN